MRTEETTDDIASYVTQIHERMKDASKMVKQQIREKHKQWYDLHARE